MKQQECKKNLPVSIGFATQQSEPIGDKTSITRVYLKRAVFVLV
jgi:hypothetical protein